MHLKRKLPWILTGKALIATGSIAMVALALATYTATVTLNFNAFFVQGMLNTAAWSMTTNTGTRYLPGNQANAGTNTPGTPATSNSSSFAFYTITGKGYVKINLAANVPTADYNAFNVFVLTWNTSSWNNATLYASSAYSTTGHIVGGLSGTGANASALTAYLLIGQTPQTFYAIQVNYILAPTPGASTTVTFNYTPSLT